MTMNCTLEEHEYQAYEISRYLLASLYCVMALVVLLFLVPLFRETTGKVWQRLFYTFVLIGTLLRGLSFFMQPSIAFGYLEVNNSVNVFVNTYPSIVFFSAYFVILFLWIEIFHTTTMETKGSSIKQFRHVYIALNVIMHMLFWALFLIDYLTSEEWDDPDVPSYITPTQITIVAFCALIYFILTVAFGFYGFKFYATFVELSQNLTVHQAKRQAVVTKLLRITVLFTMFFTVRFLLVLFGIIYALTACYWWFDPVYYALCELLAICLMFTVFKTQSAREERPLDSVADSERTPINQPAQGWYSKGVSGRDSFR